MTGLVTVAVFNATGGSNPTDVGRFGTWFDDLECDVAIVSEVFRFAKVLRHCGHLTVGKDSHGCEDVGIITKRPVRRSSVTQVTAFIPRPGSDKPLLWHDRWVARASSGRLRNYVVAASSHAPAAIQDPATRRLLDNPGAREWRDKGLPATATLLRGDMRRNRPLVHGGDLNQREGTDPANPARMYSDLGMEYRTHEVMWFGWNPLALELVREEWLPTPPGSDGHPTGLFTLRRRNRKEKP